MEEKNILRKKYKAARKEFPREYIEKTSAEIFAQIEKLPNFKVAENIFIYINYSSEIITKNFIEKYLGTKNIYVPKIVGENMELILLKDFSELEKNSFGILEPTTNEYYTGKVDLVITPGLAFSKKGYRLGYGKGHYDKYFARKKYKLAIGVCATQLLVDYLPQDNFDQAVDLVVTEQGILEISGEKND